MLINLSKKNKGFTLTEVMISITVFVFVLVNILQFFIFNNKNSQDNRNVFIANGLGAECIENITKMRDDNYLNSYSYNTGIYYGNDHTAILVYDLDNNTWDLDFGNDNNTENITSCSHNKTNYCAVYKDEISSRYTQTRSNPGSNLKESGFFRLVKIDNFTNYMKISCYVSWNEKGLMKKITLEKDLWDWNN